MTQPYNQRTRAKFVLDSGEAFPGFLLGAAPDTEIAGTVAFTTDMFGYERKLCTPDRDGQILVFATPQIGNVGWTGEGAGEGRTDITVGAVVIRDLSRIASNQKAQRGLDAELSAQGVTGIWGVDTRKLVRTVAAQQREGKTVRGEVVVDKQDTK